ncbi:MAG: AhpC/TSA family protein [Alistipes sp.]|nr:AhpC/TSA family protein [Alistipes sp.]
MRRVFLYLFVVVVAVACKSRSQFTLSCTIAGATEGEQVCLIYPIKRGEVWHRQCDTSYINTGKARFEGVAEGVVPASLVFANMDEVEIFVEPSDVELYAERNAPYDYSISGLSIDDELREYCKFFASYNRDIYNRLSLIQRKNELWAEAYAKGADNTESLWAEFNHLVAEYRTKAAEWAAMAVEFAEQHPDYAILPNIIDRFVRSGYDVATAEQMCDNLSDKQCQSLLGELMTIRRDIDSLNGGRVGSRALEFTLSSVDGDRVKLPKCNPEGYLLLDFWASWCQPCIKEIPNIRQLNEQYSDRLQIISISLDNDPDQWLNAVKRHNLTEWTQLLANNTDAEEYYFSEQADISAAYGVEQIPCFILIDDAGTIIGRYQHLTAQQSIKYQ